MNTINGSAKSAPSEAPGQLATILVVDDEASIRQLLEWILDKLGYRVLVAESGEQALKMSMGHATEPFDILITDLFLPGMSGFELAAELRLTRPEMRTLFISGTSEEEFVAEHGEMPQSAFVGKPFRAGKIQASLLALMEGQPCLR